MPAVVVVVVVVVVGGTVSQWSVDGHCELPTTTAAAAAHVTPTSQPSPAYRKRALFSLSPSSPSSFAKVNRAFFGDAAASTARQPRGPLTD